MRVVEGSADRLGPRHRPQVQRPVHGRAQVVQELRVRQQLELLDDRLMVLKGMHFSEVIVARNLGQARNQGGCVVAEVDVLLGEVHRDFNLRHGPQLSKIGHCCPVDRWLVIDTCSQGIQ